MTQHIMLEINSHIRKCKILNAKWKLKNEKWEKQIRNLHAVLDAALVIVFLQVDVKIGDFFAQGIAVDTEDLCCADLVSTGLF